jgi:prepilin-type N-terminal cleavage/methylation domain-containing protein
MSLKQTKSRGFTIVELLIVIVVIAILAAITIVAYNGIQNRAKTSAGLAGANALLKKIEAFNTVNAGYPTFCQFVTNSMVPTGAAPTSPATGLGTCAAGGASAGTEPKLDNNTQLMQPTSNAGAGYDSTVSKGNTFFGYVLCSATTGANVYYWDYSASTIKELSVGTGC